MQAPKAERKTTCINRHAHQWFFGANFVNFLIKSWEIFWKNVVFSSVKLTNFAVFFFFVEICAKFSISQN
jgi:hypothetical protein